MYTVNYSSQKKQYIGLKQSESAQKIAINKTLENLKTPVKVKAKELQEFFFVHV